MTTLLTGPIPPEIEAQFKARGEAITRAEIIALEIWLQGYLSGDVDLDRFIRSARVNLVRMGISDRARQRILGEMSDRAMSFDKPKMMKGKKGFPIAGRKMVAELVTIVVEEEQLGKSRSEATKGVSAFKRTMEILHKNGLNEITENQIIKWYNEYKDVF